jgi:dynactin complex subunit
MSTLRKDLKALKAELKEKETKLSAMHKCYVAECDLDNTSTNIHSTKAAIKEIEEASRLCTTNKAIAAISELLISMERDIKYYNKQRARNLRIIHDYYELPDNSPPPVEEKLGVLNSDGVWVSLDGEIEES